MTQLIKYKEEKFNTMQDGTGQTPSPPKAQKAVVNGRYMEVANAARNCIHLKTQEYLQKRMSMNSRNTMSQILSY